MKKILKAALLVGILLCLQGCNMGNNQGNSQGGSENASGNSQNASENGSGDNLMEDGLNSGSENVNSEESAAYQSWFGLEQSSPAIGDEGSNVPVGELLSRAQSLEEFMTTYPDSIYADEAREQYQTLMVAAISGGYDNLDDNTHQYLSEDQTMINGETVNEYNAFVNANADSKTGKLIDEYVTILGEEERAFSDRVKDFYKDLPNRMQDSF